MSFEDAKQRAYEAAATHRRRNETCGSIKVRRPSTVMECLASSSPALLPTPSAPADPGLCTTDPLPSQAGELVHKLSSAANRVIFTRETRKRVFTELQSQEQAIAAKRTEFAEATRVFREAEDVLTSIVGETGADYIYDALQWQQ